MCYIQSANLQKKNSFGFLFLTFSRRYFVNQCGWTNFQPTATKPIDQWYFCDVTHVTETDKEKPF